jgi:hypothetical protein
MEELATQFRYQSFWRWSFAGDTLTDIAATSYAQLCWWGGKLMDSDFELLFRRQGIVNFTYHPEMLTDPQVLAQKWCHPPTGDEYLIDEFYRLFGKNDFRKVLRRIYTAESGVARDKLTENCGEARLEDYLRFLTHQELAVEHNGLVFKHARYQHASGIGRTLEWYVGRWFQECLQCPARYNIHIPDMGDSGGWTW